MGLYQDLAVSVDRGGAEAWSSQDVYAHSASAGCPPDDFNLRGQDWGLLPLLPERLRARAYAPFIAVLRANMRHAGALRIDHVMGLARLFWVPRGDLPNAGSYVSYPFEHLLAILTLESQRNNCMVIGEDLGTVPDEVRHAMDSSGLLSYRVLIFSRRGDGEFLAPGEFPHEALVTSTTHDLATLVGYWESRDIDLRHRLGLYPNDAVHVQQVEERKRDCARLLAALQREGLLPPELGPDPRWPMPMTPALANAVQEYLARTPARVLAVQLEDISARASRSTCRHGRAVRELAAQAAGGRRRLGKRWPLRGNGAAADGASAGLGQTARHGQSGSLRLKAHSKCSCHLEHCCKAWIAALAQRLVKALAAEPGITCHLGHSPRSRNVTKCPGDSGNVIGRASVIANRMSFACEDLSPPARRTIQRFAARPDIAFLAGCIGEYCNCAWPAGAYCA